MVVMVLVVLLLLRRRRRRLVLLLLWLMMDHGGRDNGRRYGALRDAGGGEVRVSFPWVEAKLFQQGSVSSLGGAEVKGHGGQNQRSRRREER